MRFSRLSARLAASNMIGRFSASPSQYRLNAREGLTASDPNVLILNRPLIGHLDGAAGQTPTGFRLSLGADALAVGPDGVEGLVDPGCVSAVAADDLISCLVAGVEVVIVSATA